MESSQRQKKEVCLLIGLIALATAFDIAVPFISKILIDQLVAFFKTGVGNPGKMLVYASLGILGATILGRLVHSAYEYRLFKIVISLEDELRYMVVEKYLQLHAMFHNAASSGQIIGRIERGAQSIYAILHDIIGHNLLPPLLVFLGVIITLFWKDHRIALIVFLPLPIYVLCVKKIADQIYEMERQANEKFEQIAKDTYDVAANVLTVKKFHQEKIETANQAELMREAREIQFRAEYLWKFIENLQIIIATIGRISVILFAGYLVITKQASIGEFVLYMTLQNMAYGPLGQLSVVFPRLRRNTARAERLFDILDEEILVTDKPDAKELPPHTQSIELRGVSFRYASTAKRALKNLNLTIPAGKTVALVGRSGSGKTTFINLLLRSFDPDEGAILIDGYDLRDVTRESLLKQIAVVPQEVDLFSRTILENIAYGKTDVERDEVMSAAQTALAHDFIMQTEQGYDTPIGERGMRVSGGERQRIGLARAIYRDPRILILDEATSHLDTESERMIAQAADALIKNRTTFIIAHRLSTILHADIILVFAKGKIEAMGKHEELLNTSPTYSRLFELQFNDSED